MRRRRRSRPRRTRSSRFTATGRRHLRSPSRSCSTMCLYFKESLRGLSVGAPVNFLGLPVGEVTEVGLEYNPATVSVGPRVESRSTWTVSSPTCRSRRRPERRPRPAGAPAPSCSAWSIGGARAQLQTGSLISGQLYVAIDYFPDAPKVKHRLDPRTAPVPDGARRPGAIRREGPECSDEAREDAAG